MSFSLCSRRVVDAVSRSASNGYAATCERGNKGRTSFTETTQFHPRSSFYLWRTVSFASKLIEHRSQRSVDDGNDLVGVQVNKIHRRAEVDANRPGAKHLAMDR